MKQFLFICLMSLSLFAQGQFSFTPGVNNIYTVGSYDYMVAYAADMKAGDSVKAIVVHAGLYEDSAFEGTDYSYNKFVADGWDMKLVRATGDTLKFIILFIPHRGFTMARVQPAVDQTFNYFVDLGFLDSSNHSNFAQVSISKGGQVMWYFNRNYQDHNSLYRLQLAKRTMTLSTMSLSSSAFEVNATTMNYPGRHAVLFGTTDGGDTDPSHSRYLYNTLIHANSVKRMDSIVGGGHTAAVWNQATTVAGYGTPGINNSNNLLAWVLDLDATTSNIAPIADAGPDQVTTSSTITLNGTNSTDSDGTITAWQWTKVSGTGSTIASPTANTTTVSGLSPGTYVFRLTVTDDEGATNSDDITITVNSSPGVLIWKGRSAVFN